MIKKIYIFWFLFLLQLFFHPIDNLFANETVNTKDKNSTQKIEFNIRWFAYDFAIHNPIETGQLFPPNMRLRPVKSEQTSSLNYHWKQGLKTEDAVYKQFVTVAEAVQNFTKGNYEFSITWNAAVRIYVDGKLVFDEWNSSIQKSEKPLNRKIKLELKEVQHLLIEHVATNEIASLCVSIKKID